MSVFGSALPPFLGSTGGEEAYTPQVIVMSTGAESVNTDIDFLPVQLRRAMRAATNDAEMAPAVIELSLVEGLAGARGVRAEKEVV